MPATTPPASTHPTPGWEPPGGVLVWLIVLVELVTFGIGLLVLLRLEQAEPAVFARGRATLNQAAGLLYTILLLTGGWLMTGVLGALRRGQVPAARRWLQGSLAAGGAFLALKGTEYAAKLAQGQGLNADAFFTLYWLLTGFHFLHVAVAVALLLAMERGLYAGRYTAVDHGDVVSSGVFWHLCDLIWLLLYPLLYLL